MSATIYDERAKALSSIETVAGSETEIFDAADRLAQHILAGMQVRPLALAGVAGQSTSSLPAFKAYLEGERELRSGRYAEAQEAFRRATELDTTFALAYYRLAILTPAPENQVGWIMRCGMVIVWPSIIAGCSRRSLPFSAATTRRRISARGKS